jgi:hypothetical protein
MKFFRRPPLNSVRRRFAWWPTRITLFNYGYRPIKGAEPIKFYPGWTDDLGGFGVPNKYPSPAYPSVANRNIRQELCGGMVVPVTHMSEAVNDEWVWLEWNLEQLSTMSDRNGNNMRTGWIPTLHRKQWNLWHEYY